MRKTAEKIAAGLVVLTMSVAPAFSGDISPVGQWQSATGESRYEVTMCGDGTKLCARLTWLRADARTADNVKLLNKYVVRGARPTDENQWRGTVHYAGGKAGGSVKLLSSNKMRLSGCKMIMCQTFDFHRL